ncbi:hypothetical protein NQZ68_012028 [Dissostichus eleginoides]|nr:hypothetical protein NQZ68_012028 [Dissostichus eleginoides]
MCLPIQWSRKACKVTDSNAVTCVPTNDSPQGESIIAVDQNPVVNFACIGRH